ncbi:MAG: hypothetical protein RI947_154 [Candidatus Parcubacteria bacterium]|jgi:hypothetical protein
MKFYQYIIAGISLWFIATRLLRFLRREQSQSLFKFMTFLVIWSTIFLIAVFPRVASYLAALAGLNGDGGMIILLGFIIVFLIIFKLLSVIEHMERNITQIVRRDALRDLKYKQRT